MYFISMRTLILVSVLTGCASRGFQYPGPLGSLGAEPPPYADGLGPQEFGVESSSVKKSRARRNAKQGEAVARSAVKLLGKSRMVVDGERFRYDCSGMVSAAYTDAGIGLDGNGSSMHALAKKNGTLHHRKTPAIGDVVFFDNTWDRNGNGRRDDKLTHVAIVESIDADGTQTLVHLGGSGINRLMMNLEQTSVYRDENGKILNSYLRSGKSGDRLSGQLWSGYASLWDVDTDAALTLNGCQPRPVIQGSRSAT